MAPASPRWSESDRFARELPARTEERLRARTSSLRSKSSRKPKRCILRIVRTEADDDVGRGIERHRAGGRQDSRQRRVPLEGLLSGVADHALHEDGLAAIPDDLDADRRIDQVLLEPIVDLLLDHAGRLAVDLDAADVGMSIVPSLSTVTFNFEASGSPETVMLMTSATPMV